MQTTYRPKFLTECMLIAVKCSCSGLLVLVRGTLRYLLVDRAKGEVWHVPEWKANYLSWEVGSTRWPSCNGGLRPTWCQKLASHPGNPLSSSNLGLSFSRRGCSCGVALRLVWNLQWPLRRSCKPFHVTPNPGRADLLKYIVNRISQTEGSMGWRQREIFSRLRYGMQLGNGGLPKTALNNFMRNFMPAFVDA